LDDTIVSILGEGVKTTVIVAGLLELDLLVNPSTIVCHGASYKLSLLSLKESCKLWGHKKAINSKKCTSRKVSDQSKNHPFGIAPQVHVLLTLPVPLVPRTSINLEKPQVTSVMVTTTPNFHAILVWLTFDIHPDRTVPPIPGHH
jgi:hypothetical protein